MSRQSIALAAALIVLLGCERQSSPLEAAIPPRTTSTMQGSDRVEASDIPGVFVAKGMRLELLANGRYRMRVHAESANADLDREGTWTSDGNEVLLKSSDSSEPEQVLLVWSRNALESHDGKQTLRREGSQ